MKSTSFLFPFDFSSKFLGIKQICHVVLQLALLWLPFEMKLSYCCALVILHTTNLQSSLLKFLMKLENQLLQINPQGLDQLEPRFKNNTHPFPRRTTQACTLAVYTTKRHTSKGHLKVYQDTNQLQNQQHTKIQKLKDTALRGSFFPFPAVFVPTSRLWYHTQNCRIPESFKLEKISEITESNL